MSRPQGKYTLPDKRAREVHTSWKGKRPVERRGRWLDERGREEKRKTKQRVLAGARKVKRVKDKAEGLPHDPARVPNKTAKDKEIHTHSQSRKLHTCS